MSCELLVAAATLPDARCQPTDDGFLVSLPVLYSDGDVPQVLACVVDGEWVLDDLGATRGRLFDRGLDYTDSMDKTLDAIADEHRMSVVDGALTAWCGSDGLPDTLARFASALVQADAIAVLAIPERAETFAERVARWISDVLDVPYASRSSGVSAGGRTYHPTMLTYRTTAERDARDPTLVQAVDDVRGIEHAHYMFTNLEGRFGVERFLIVASDRAYDRKADIRSLTQVGYVTHTTVVEPVAAWLTASDEQRATYSRDLTQPSLT